MKIDNFALTTHQACPAKYDLRMNQGWTSRRKSGALGFGAAFHEGLSVWYKLWDRPTEERLMAGVKAITENWDTSVPVDDYRTMEKCVDTFLEYVKAYPSENFRPVMGAEGPLIEINFTIDTGMTLPCFECGQEAGNSLMGTKAELDIAGFTEEDYASCSFVGHLVFHTECPNCGAMLEPIEYGGIFDGLVEFNGTVYVLEHKTTSQMGAYYFNQFKPNNQVSGYVWAAGLLSGKKVGGAVINAICTRKTGKPEFKRQITTRSQSDIDKWLFDIYTECVNIKQHEKMGHWPFRTISCQQYGACEFYDVHSLSGEQEQQQTLELKYIKSNWDYEARDVAKPEVTP